MAKIEVKINGKVVAEGEVDDTSAAVGAAQETAAVVERALSRIRQTNLSDTVEIVVGDMPPEADVYDDDEGDDSVGLDDDRDPDEEE